MGCQCTNDNQTQDHNEVTKDLLVPNQVIDKKQQESFKDTNQLFDSLGKEGCQIEEDGLSNNNMNHNKASADNSKIITNYNERIFKIINTIRCNPSAYAQNVEDSMCNIQMDNNRLIYKSKVKVTLGKGRQAFEDCASKLRTTPKMSPLIFKDEIIIPLPETKEQLKDMAYFKDKVKETQQRCNIDVFFRDLVKEPETSALLMIVDDLEKNPGKKRGALLNPELKYIGVSSTFIGHSFVAYFSFSK